MESGLLAFMELFVVLAVAIGWGILELVGLRLDRRKREREAAARDTTRAE